MAGSAENNWAIADKPRAIQFCREKAISMGFRPENNWSEKDNQNCLTFLRKQQRNKFGLTMVGEFDSVKALYLGERAVLDEMRLVLAPVYDDELLPRPIVQLRREISPKETLTGVCRNEVLLSRRFANTKLLEQFEMNVLNKLSIYNPQVAVEDRISDNSFKELYGINEYMKKDKKMVQETCIEMMNDFINYVATFNLCQEVVDQGGKCYFYVFEHYNPALFHGFNLFMPFTGATHCTELAYVFDVNVLLKPWKRSDEDVKVRNMVTTMWTNFAKYGNPNSVRFDVNWAPVSKEHPGRHLVVKSKPEMCNQFDGFNRVKRLSVLFKEYVHGIYSNNNQHTV